MKCLNCNLSVPDGAETCPFCNAKLNSKYRRCQNCFKIIEPSCKVCPNCGTKVSESETHEGFYQNKERKTALQKTKEFIKNTVLFKILCAVFAVVVIIGTVLGILNAKKGLISDMEKYQTEIVQNMENIKQLSQEYNTVYDGQWLIQTDNVSKIETDCADIINDCRESRTSIYYLCQKIKGKCNSKKDKKIVNDYFNSYEACYLYVVERHGTYPGYMTGFEKLYAEFDKCKKKYSEYMKKIKK